MCLWTGFLESNAAPPSSQEQGPKDESSKQSLADVALHVLLSLTSQALFSFSEAG